MTIGQLYAGGFCYTHYSAARWLIRSYDSNGQVSTGNNACCGTSPDTGTAYNTNNAVCCTLVGATLYSGADACCANTRSLNSVGYNSATQQCCPDGTITSKGQSCSGK